MTIIVIISSRSGSGSISTFPHPNAAVSGWLAGSHASGNKHDVRSPFSSLHFPDPLFTIAISISRAPSSAPSPHLHLHGHFSPIPMDLSGQLKPRSWSAVRCTLPYHVCMRYVAAHHDYPKAGATQRRSQCGKNKGGERRGGRKEGKEGSTAKMCLCLWG